MCFFHSDPNQGFLRPTRPEERVDFVDPSLDSKLFSSTALDALTTEYLTTVPVGTERKRAFPTLTDWFMTFQVNPFCLVQGHLHKIEINK